MALNHEADWSVVTGDRFRERRERLGYTQEQIAELAGIKSYETVSAVEHGKASPRSRRSVDAALSQLEEEAFGSRAEVDDQQPAPAPQLMEFEVTGDFGVRVVVKGPVENAAELEASVARLIRDMRTDRD